MQFTDLDGHQVVANVLLDRLRRAVQYTPDSRCFVVSSGIDGSVSVIYLSTRAIIDKLLFEPGVRDESIQPAGCLPWGVVVAP